MMIDLTRLLGRSLKGRLPTGVDRVSLEYVRHFGDRARAVVRLGGRSMVLPRSASRRLFDVVLGPVPAVPRSLLKVAGRSVLPSWSARGLRGAFLFNTGHSGLEHGSYPAELRRLGVRPLFLVHDLIPISHPEYCRHGELEKHAARMRTALRTASGVITNSRVTLQELAGFADKSSLPMPPAVAAPLAPPDLPAPSAARPLESPYFVMLGTIEPRKNHWLLLQLWRKLAERMRARTPRLVIIGQRGWECENVVDMLERCEPLRGIVIEQTACSDAELSTYLHHAQAMLFPSFAEGYGIPLVEALSLGVPVIASDLPVFREIAGDVPDYIDPLDGMGWLGRIEAFVGPASPARAAQRDRLAGYTPPTWSAHFRVVEEFMERLP